MSKLGGQVESYLGAVSEKYSEASLVVHQTGLRLFQLFAEEHGLECVSEVTELVFREFHTWVLFSFDYAPATVDLRLRSAKLFLKWSSCRGLVLYDAEDYKFERPESVIPEPPTVAVMKRFLELPNLRTPEGLRVHIPRDSDR